MQTIVAGFINKTLKIDDTTYPYALYVPHFYSSDKKWPVILFLHGRGERGNNGLQQTKVGIGPALRLYSDRYPALVVMPQCPKSEKQWTDKMADFALKALDQTINEFQDSVDSNRLYLTGLSMGGGGSWFIASKHPEKFAAVVPICGTRTIEPVTVAKKLKDMPIWVFHGDKDGKELDKNSRPKGVPVKLSCEMVDAIGKVKTVEPICTEKLDDIPKLEITDGPEERSRKLVARSRMIMKAIKAQGNVKTIIYTKYPGVGHNCWENAYSEIALTEWLFAQKKEER